jgi:hypothetical protein
MNHIRLVGSRDDDGLVCRVILPIALRDTTREDDIDCTILLELIHLFLASIIEDDPRPIAYLRLDIQRLTISLIAIDGVE